MALDLFFVLQAGSDEGGISTEMFRLLFDGMLSPRCGLWEHANSDQDRAAGQAAAHSGAESNGPAEPLGGASGARLFLPRAGTVGARESGELEATGRALARALIEGKSVGHR